MDDSKNLDFFFEKILGIGPWVNKIEAICNTV